MSKVCNTCQHTLNIQVEYNLKDYNVIIKEGCLHCKLIVKSELEISKQDINFHIEQLLNNNTCGKCNNNVVIDDIKHCKLGLTIFIYIRCLYCGTHYIIVKPCNSEEELKYLCIQVAESTIKDKGFVKVKA